MNALPPFDWLTLVHALGWSLLHFLWQGALIGVAYLGARRLARESNPELRYACGMGAIVLAALCPIATCLLILGAQDAGPAPAAAMAVASGFAVGAARAVQPGLSGQALSWLVALWLSGVLVMALRSFQQWRSLDRVVRFHAILDPELQRMGRTLAAKLGYLRDLRVRVTDRIDTPTLAGWFRPVILLPAALVLRFPRQQLELILAHEVGHLRRFDHWANLLQAVVETLLFYHPVVHWISQEVRNDRELCCDRLVLRSTRHEPYLYARTLAELEEWRQRPARLTLAATGGHLLDRVRRIVGIIESDHRPAALRPSLLQGIAVAALLAVVVTAVDRGRTAGTGPAVEVAAARPLPFASLRIAADFDVAAEPVAFNIVIPELAATEADTAEPVAAPPADADSTVAATLPGSGAPAPAAAAAAAAPVSAAPQAAAAGIAAEWPTLQLESSAAAPSADTEAQVAAGSGQAVWATPDLMASGEAFADGIQPVELELHLTDQGRVLGSRVVRGDPFSPLAVQARREVKLWQFEREGPLLDRRAVVRPVFVPDGSEPRLIETRIEVPCQSRTGTRICRPWTPVETTVEFMRGSELLTADAFLVLRGAAG
ncbi:MAG TPA: M56 family metallopeptidase [Dokdonella sp.]|uniref:M56 family metallopeptidase n=1 Tax=Dokdonella sp. TaxID=2291710 RepID=UPI002C9958FE|nr:M56 family metallopeptidase [Dokdonella sp.]HUD42242.1 M56 family metallopeptidase [Dokdonella sp.]